MKELLQQDLDVVNVGLQSFASNITAAGGRFLARGMPAAVKEAGVMQRTVLVEFDNLAAAQAAYDSPMYKEALDALGTGNVEREIRIIEGA